MANRPAQLNQEIDGQHLAHLCRTVAYERFYSYTTNRRIDIYEADDLAQELAIKYIDNADASSPTGLIYVAARNKLIDWTRRANLRAFQPLDDVVDDDAVEMSLLKDGDACDDIRRLRARLSVTEVKVMDAMLVTDNNRVVAAARLGISPGTVSNHLSAVRFKAKTATHRVEQSRGTIREYRASILRASMDPVDDFLSIDATGDAAAFFNWVDDPFFADVLQACAEFSARRRQRRPRSVGARRYFLVDPRRVSIDYVSNFRVTVRRHLYFGIEVGVILANQRTLPADLASDIASYGRCCADFGHLEFMGATDLGLRSTITSTTDLSGRRIRERVAAATDPRFVDVVIRNVDELVVFCKYLSGLINAR